MEMIIVPDGGLVRAGGRLAAALSKAHDAIMLSAAEFGLSAAPPSSVGVVYLADEIPAALNGSRKDGLHGVSWGTQGNQAWISAGAVDDPQGTLDAMGAVIADLQSASKEALANLGPIPDPTRIRGPHIAGFYLDPKLRVPAQTVAGGHFSFTPERMCWERQYTLGVVHFLANGFDAWAGEISG